jgi:hypothetical protein
LTVALTWNEQRALLADQQGEIELGLSKVLIFVAAPRSCRLTPTSGRRIIESHSLHLSMATHSIKTLGIVGLALGLG